MSFGEVAEWSIAAVLKTVELRGSGGSNPSLSALNSLQGVDFQPCRLFLCPKSCTKNAPTPFLRTSTGVFQIAHIPFSHYTWQHEMWGGLHPLIHWRARTRSRTWRRRITPSIHNISSYPTAVMLDIMAVVFLCGDRQKNIFFVIFNISNSMNV